MNLAEETFLLFSDTNNPSTQEQLCHGHITKELLLLEAVERGYIVKKDNKYFFSSSFILNTLKNIESKIAKDQESLAKIKRLSSKVVEFNTKN